MPGMQVDYIHPCGLLKVNYHDHKQLRTPILFFRDIHIFQLNSIVRKLRFEEVIPPSSFFVESARSSVRGFASVLGNGEVSALEETVQLLAEEETVRLWAGEGTAQLSADEETGGDGRYCKSELII